MVSLAPPQSDELDIGIAVNGDVVHDTMVIIEVVVCNCYPCASSMIPFSATEMIEVNKKPVHSR